MRVAGFEITNCDLKAAERSAAFGSLREMADSGEKEVVMELVPAPAIQKRILLVRERQVMLDEGLADLYGVETRHLVQQVKRNIERFPADFMFQLTKGEAAALRSQTATSDAGRRTPDAADAATRPTCSPSRESRCSPESFGASGQWRST
jgi:hypothetical protein